MNKEQQELLEDAYKNYAAKTSMDVDGQYTKEEFINKRKTDSEFSEQWGLKIEERELTWQERRDIAEKTMDKKEFVGYKNEDGIWIGFGHISPFVDWAIHMWLDDNNIPTKLITITYNYKTIESYGE